MSPKVIYGPELPPPPSGMSLFDASVLRGQLEEDTLQILGKYIRDNGGGSTNGVASYDFVRDFGGVGDGVTDNTAAFQLAFTTAGVETTRIFFPAGIYLYGNNVTYLGGPGKSLYLQGEGGLDPDAQSGTVFQFNGTLGGDGMHFRGMRFSIISDICFSGGNKADKSCWSSEKESPLVPSFSCFWMHCGFVHPRGGGADVCFRMGKDGTAVNLQCSEYRFYGCNFGGNGPAPSLALFHGAATANTKNVLFQDCTGDSADYFVNWSPFSGDIEANNCSLSNIGWNIDGAIFNAGGGNTILVRNLQVENSTTGFRARLFDGNPIFSLNGGYFAGNMPTDDYIITTAEQCLLENYFFDQNGRAGSNNFKFKFNSDGGNIIIRNCKIKYTTTPLKQWPLYDGSNNDLTLQDYGRSPPAQGAVQYEIIGCSTGLVGFDIKTRLPNVVSDRPTILVGSIGIEALSAGVTYNCIDNRHTFTIPYTSMNVAALTKTFTLGDIYAGTRLQTVQLYPTIAFSGNAGTLVGDLGFNITDPDGLMPALNLKTAARYGGSDTHLGALINRAAAVQGGYLCTANQRIELVVTSGSGNLSTLSSGSLIISIEMKYVI